MCGACDQQVRICELCAHHQPKRHGDVFWPETTKCEKCGGETRIDRK